MPVDGIYSCTVQEPHIVAPIFLPFHGAKTAGLVKPLSPVLLLQHILLGGISSSGPVVLNGNRSACPLSAMSLSLLGCLLGFPPFCLKHTAFPPLTVLM